MKSAKEILETDLYDPVHAYLSGLGYTVRGEVKGCDIAAVKDNELVIVELKKGITIDLLIQAARRQRITDSVYIAVPRPKAGIYSRRYRGLTHLLRRLELGLILVSFMDSGPFVEVVFHPIPFRRQKSKKTKRAIIRESTSRSGNYNKGGSTRTKIVTAYRENALQIACYLDRYGDLSPKQLRSLGTGKKTTSILGSNFYGWFERVQRGVYGLTKDGKKGIADHAELASRFRESMPALLDGPEKKA